MGTVLIMAVRCPTLFSWTNTGKSYNPYQNRTNWGPALLFAIVPFFNVSAFLLFGCACVMTYKLPITTTGALSCAPLISHAVGE